MYEIKKELDVLKKLQIRKMEQKFEENQLLSMYKEDYRTIEIEMKKEREREIQKIKWYKDNLEREAQRKKIEEESKMLIEKAEMERKEREKKIKEYNEKILILNKTCSICNINYCKCAKTNFVKDEYSIFKCVSCNKRKCSCVRITDFFK